MGLVIDFTAEENYMAMCFKDTGIPFDPFSYESEEDPNQADALSIGGRGIRIFTSIMDEYSYERRENVNIVYAKKYV